MHFLSFASAQMSYARNVIWLANLLIVCNFENAFHTFSLKSNRLESTRIDLKRFGRKSSKFEKSIRNAIHWSAKYQRIFQQLGRCDRLQRYNAVNAAHKRYERFQRKTNRNVFDRYESYEINYENRLQRLLLTFAD